MNKKNKYLIMLSIVTIISVILLISASYAWYVITVVGTKNNTIKAGTLSLVLDDETSKGISLQYAVPITDREGLLTEEYTFKLKNNGNIPSKYVIYLDDIALEDGEVRMLDKYVKYSLTKNNEAPITEILTNIGTNPNRVLDSGIIEDDTTYTYTLRLWIDKDADNAVMGTTFRGKLRVEASQIIEKNKNIKAVYKYNETETDSNYCVSGEETTCETISPTNYETGTIVKYAINDTEEKYFFVLDDDGYSLTMQQRENTVRNIAWYEDSSDNSQGPLTILAALETATSTWTNVNNQTYSLGTTNFNNTNFTGCKINNYDFICNTNTYTLPERTAKARLITAQEAKELGCSTWQNNGAANGTCPDFMHNYLYQSTNYGGSIDDNTTNSNGDYNWGYWTSSADSSNSNYEWYIHRLGHLYNYYSSSSLIGARAVIIIDK